jgi:hypothetical protein
MIGYRNNSSNIVINTYINTQTSQQPAALLDINKVGQSFYEIITQQPYKFSKNDINVGAYSLTLRWNYDQIMAKQENDNEAIVKLSNIPDNKQNLPYINKIYLDIMGNVDTDIIHPIHNNAWIRLAELNISGDYNIYDYKHYILERANYNSNSQDTYNKIIHNIISKNLPFSIRVYGENYGSNFPNVETRALVFSNLIFTYVYPPSAPLFISSLSEYNPTASINNSIILTYYNSKSIMQDTCANAVITNYNINYMLNSSLASNLINRSYLTNNVDNSAIFSTSIYSNMNFDISLVNLMSGSNYSHRIQVRNNYSNNYSEYSSISGSNYTLIPNNNLIDSTLDLSIKPICYKHISNNYLPVDTSSSLYFNIANNQHNLLFNNSSSQQFQITHPYFGTQHFAQYHYGYGKFVDNCLNLVSITISINGIIKQAINYGGFDLSNANNANNANNNYNYSINNFNTNLNNTIIKNNNNNINIQDIYENETSYINKGFRLKGYLLLRDIITYNNITSYFGDPSSNPYILNIDYSRNAIVNNTLGTNVMHYIYIDNLIGDPIISNSTSIINVSEVVYNMGVASVKYFKLIMNRTYSNINSIYKYIVGNRIIANYSTNNNISLGSENIILAQADICGNGIYIYNDLSYNIAYYEKTSANFSFNLIEKIYNLNNIAGYTINNPLITNHYCDYNSFTRSNNVIVSSKLDLTKVDVFEISNIHKLGQGLSEIAIIPYTNHSSNIMPSTLLYINSSFSNVFSSYPNSSSYNYSNYLDISYNSYGNISYNLDGSSNPSNQGYKWIVFKIYKHPTIQGAYKFNNVSYNILTTPIGLNNTNVNYLPLKSMLIASNLFAQTIVNDIFNIDNTNAVMFGHATIRTTTQSFKRYFNIKRTYQDSGKWTFNSPSNPASYSSTDAASFGSNINEEGLFCPHNDMLDDLTIYIGLKNSI